MRALDCPVCGEVVQGQDDEALLGALVGHIESEHPCEATDEAELRSRVEADAYAPPSGDPPWAY
jgi:hypothetical protein